MIPIGFIHNGNAFLPGIGAYLSFFHHFSTVKKAVISPAEIRKLKANVEWHFMGTHCKRSASAIVIHEYASASVSPFTELKNTVKRWYNCTPDYRIFSSQHVRGQFSFKDKAEYGYRSHGVLRTACSAPENALKEYDFIYVGNLDKGRRLDALFECFVNGKLKDRRLLILSDHYGELAKKMSFCRNIGFEGPVHFNDV